jgi:hypothetical protein
MLDIQNHRSKFNSKHMSTPFLRIVIDDIWKIGNVNAGGRVFRGLCIEKAKSGENTLGREFQTI